MSKIHAKKVISLPTLTAQVKKLVYHLLSLELEVGVIFLLFLVPEMNMNAHTVRILIIKLLLFLV